MRMNPYFPTYYNKLQQLTHLTVRVIIVIVGDLWLMGGHGPREKTSACITSRHHNSSDGVCPSVCLRLVYAYHPTICVMGQVLFCVSVLRLILLTKSFVLVHYPHRSNKEYHYDTYDLESGEQCFNHLSM